MRTNSFLTHILDHLFKSKKRKDSRTETKDKSQTTHADEKEQPLFTPENVLHSLQVEILKDGGDGNYIIAFQGGVFLFFFEDDRLKVMFNDVMECSYSDILKATLIANEINGAYSVWSCYLHYTNNAEADHPVKVCFSQMFPLIGDFDKTIQLIRYVLASVFAISREFKNQFNRTKNDKVNLTNLLNQKDFAYKLEKAKRLLELHSLDDLSQEMPPASYLRIDTLADLFNDTSFGKPQSLTLVRDGQLQTLTNEEEVVHFDIRSYVRNLNAPNDLTNMTIIASFEIQDLVINLKKMPGSSNNSLFFSLNLLRTGVEDDMITHNRSVTSFRDTIEIRLTTEQEDYWELKYMLEEARDKNNRNDISSMTDEQKMMLMQLSPNLQDDLYWGFKFYNEDCLFQSLFYFKRLFYNLHTNHNRNRFDEGLYADISLYIGIIYCQLRKYELAFYYLEKTNKYESILASEWYINCLCSLKDSSAYRYIKHMLDYVSRNLQMTDISNTVRDEFYQYYLFLKRRLVQTLINELRLTEAETLVNEMMARDENVAFCTKELENIRKIRTKEADNRDKVK